VQWEEYFDFDKVDTKYGVVDRIRLKGSRVRLEVVVEEFHKGATPQQIAEWYPTLTLQQVYVAITYYLYNKADVDEYIQRGEAVADAFYQEYLKQEPSPLRKRLQALRAQQQEGMASNEP